MTSLNSVISDPEPYVPPKVKEEKVEPSDWQKLAKSNKLPEINAYLENRKEYYRRFLPDGTPIENLKPEDRVAAWDRAVCVIKEIEGIQSALTIYE